ncbi:MAG: hypothetical protein AAF609_15365 [Cyanobacteria bacterium P01_C01_bin.120]
MTTHQLLFKASGQSQSASGFDMLFFLLGSRNSSDDTQEQSSSSILLLKNPMLGLGLSIIGFTLAGAWTCLHAMA